ncbi:TPA: phosphoadenosine phosphosulfate reductase family protein [Klebsiella pneumoniae subsp. pneumoniae]|uniref:phosphoadenosine phosphosulfate reductase family protein n=1 Tax=Klebsiella TaxID=570 RepID=UPI000E00B929|nr:phosphoadenosine phosphosulfate reductase family protein [Klebsiella pneumoniae]HBQ5789750.1 phosphoadenosine phosphosulfate reductase family protein [Klebsiella pneumoniae subsp. pneumoniae]MCP5764889.1 phosphoadenosine phosphosulfate reductase family protein [Klebsiella pneumoniae]MDR4745696.1 phosphoadenosine phosphosulfate reductase family protein [Klebsiella pneumoniae]MDW1494914.1 phosphoadenosine phosphosulfate reductase family protein [Klebsiella pneumoniae]STU73382.1 PUA domain (pr
MAERHVLGISGGKDSAALAIYMRQHHPELNIEYFFTDTGKELPEVYDFLGKLEGFLGKKIEYLNPDRDFDFWLKEYNNFLPSPQTRWCTRQLKLRPFELWVRPMLAAGYTVTSYVAIRADEEYREGYASKHKNLRIALPFRDNGIDKAAVGDILEASGVGWPEYYKWRSRSGCTFCFFQQKIEWARLKEHHPEAFEEAKAYEKNALDHGSPFTWSQGESLSELEKPDRIIQIFKDYEERKARMSSKKPVNPLRPIVAEDIDDIYGDDEGNGSCNICHK